MPQIDAPSHGERVGIFAVAVDLVVGEKASVSVVVAVVKRRRLKMTCGVGFSVTQCFKMDFFYFADLNE